MNQKQLQFQLQKYNEMANLLQNTRFYQEMLQALDTHFEVLVLATMSAGKSTLLNAMLGMDMLPYSNQACTSVVYRIEDDDYAPAFRCRAVKDEAVTEWEPANPETLKKWNDSEFCTLVEVIGNLPFIRNRGAHMVFYDTPGPNNSMDNRHAQAMRSILHSKEYGLILIVLDATNLNTNDEFTLLEDVKKADQNRRKKVIFVLNKVDCLDEERGESLECMLKNARTHLKGLGFPNPMIMPVMAEAAKLLRMAALGSKLTRKQKSEVSKYISCLQKDWGMTRFQDRAGNEKSQETRADGNINALENRESLFLKPSESSSGISIDGQTISYSEINHALYGTGIHPIELILEDIIYHKALPGSMRKVEHVLRKYRASSLQEWLKEK
jgi:50S ribosomal subunit-associated GTPase HflX